jgi:thioredoxin reductase (NADPH)
MGRKVFYYIDPSVVAHESKDVLLVGGGDAAMDQALSFSKKARTVTVAVKHDRPRCAPALADRIYEAGIRVMKGRKVSSLGERGERVLVDFESCEGVLFDLVIACVGKERNFDFLGGELGDSDTPGLFFAGDCWRKKDRHISIAIGDGVAAAMKAAEYIGCR